MLDQIQQILKDNNFAQGGLFVLLSGSALGLLYKCLGYIRLFFTRTFFVNIKTVSNSDTFYYLQHWLEQTTYTKKYCSNLLVSRYGDNELYKPSYGRHIFVHKWRLFVLNFSIEGDKTNRTENIDLSAFSLFSKRKLAQNIIEEGKNLLNKKEYKGTNIYINDCGYWHKHTIKKGCYVPILENDATYKNFVKDIEKFTENENWYIKQGINFKRGYLFYGKPGNGKTTAILSLAQYFQKDLYILNLAESFLTEKQFLILVGAVPSNGFLCIEDIDATTNNVKERNKNKEIKGKSGEPPSLSSEESSVCLSTILNTFDGLYTPHGLIVFITTNYIEKLDSALLRKGRMDYSYEFKNANEYQIVQLFNKYFPNIVISEKFNKWALDKPMSEVHSKLIEHKDSIENLLGDII